MPAELCFLAAVMNEKATIWEIKLKMVLYCLRATVRSYRRADGKGFAVTFRDGTAYLTPDQLADLGSTMNFLFTKNDNGYQLDVKLWKNPCPKIEVDGKRLFGPDDGLNNISYGQFVMLLTWQQRAQHERLPAIRKMLSVVWKEGKFTTDENESDLLDKLGNEFMVPMLWFIQGSINLLTEKFPKVFSGGDVSGNVFDSQQRIIDELADGDVTKKDKVRKSMLYDALYSIDNAIDREERLNSLRK